MARTSSNSFMGMDVPNFMDFTKFADLTKFTEQFKVPAVDTEALLDSQRKNIEAFSAANRIAFEGAQAVTQRQVEILRQVMEESAAVVKQFTAACLERAWRRGGNDYDNAPSGLVASVENDGSGWRRC